MRASFTAVALCIAFAAEQAVADPVIIRMANSVPANSHMNVRIFTPWCERVTAESGGTVEAKLYPANLIATSNNVWDRVLTGVVDIGYVSPSYVGGKFPKSRVTEVPFLVGRSADSSIAFWKMIDHGSLAPEFAEVKVLAAFVYPTSGLATPVTPIHKMEELKGKKIGVGSKMMGEWAQAMGAAPITMVYSETYDMMNRHTVDLVTAGWTGIQPLKLWEVAKGYTTVPLGSTNVVLAMNKQSYGKLPDQGKAAIDRNSGEKWTRELAVFWDQVADEGRKLVEEHNATIYDPSEAEKADWAKASEPVGEQWVRQTRDGGKALSEFRAERKKASAGM
jgi:TRAP-type C4-dicarboxylate transport system substrate-binding protein